MKQDNDKNRFTWTTNTYIRLKCGNKEAKIITTNPDILWLKYLYGSKAYYVLVYCYKMMLFENPNFKIWAIEHYYPRNLPLHETGFL